jgi:D-threo-aldose 1-dehydrogenase
LTHGAAHPEIFQQVLTETIPQLRAAREQGLVRWIGVGVNECEVCLVLLQREALDCILLAGRYTVLEQPALTSGLLEICAKRGTKLIAAGVFNSGLLASRPTATSKYNYENAPADVLARASRLWALCESCGVPPQAVALQFPAAHPVVASTVVGARSPEEIAQALVWRKAAIPGALWTALKKDGFIAVDAPLPDGDRGK